MDKKIFVTGKLACKSLKKILAKMEPEFEYRIITLNITVAALMDTEFIIKGLTKKLLTIDWTDKVHIILPGRCQLEMNALKNKFPGYVFLQGPKELLKIPDFFGYDVQDLELDKVNRNTKIIAEVADAPFLSVKEIVKRAVYYNNTGADIIDIGCIPGVEFLHLEECIKTLKKYGLKVSIDTLDKKEIIRGTTAGADIVLSLNSKNYDVVKDRDFKPVIIPDAGRGIKSLSENIKKVKKLDCNDIIIDPILDPINFGFSDSMERFNSLNKYFPDYEVLIGIGNLVELTDADTGGINAVMAGFITELKINYVLTTEASNRTTGSVRELDLALKLMSYTNSESILPKNVSQELITLREQKPEYFAKEDIIDLANKVTDRNYRIMIDGQFIYVFNNKKMVYGKDINKIYAALNIEEPSHAYYLGRELHKAYTALILGKQYSQEEKLNWGYINQEVNEPDN